MENIEKFLNTLITQGLYRAYLIYQNKEYIYADSKFLIRDLKDKSDSTGIIKPSPSDRKKEALKQAEDKHAWQVAQILNTVRSYQEYQEKLKDGLYTGKADEKIKALKDDENGWETAQRINTIDSHKKYQYP